MYHKEGGYREDHKKCLEDFMEASKYKRKKANENDSRDAMRHLIESVSSKNIVRYNSILDFFETYFDDEETSYSKDDAQTKTITLLKDPKKRTVSALDFQSDERRIAVGHSCLRFQDHSQSSDTYGYIWNLESPN
jgi:WD40 repeat protein